MSVKRDRYGRYLLPDPETGKERAWTRVTTAAKTLEDTYHLNQWAKRQVAYGMGQRTDLVDLATSADPDDKATLDDVVRQAEAAAASSKKANVGTALHGLTEKIDRGDKNVRIPEAHRDRVTRYKTCVAQHQLTFLPDWIERIVVVPELGLAGTLDRGVEWPHSELPVIGDLKTGSIDFAKVAIAQQLAAYARATHWFDGEKMHPMPAVNQELALVIHLPSTGDDEPRVYKVNIAEGWDLLQQSMSVRGVRSGRGSHLFTEITAEALPTPSADREEELRKRVRKIVDEGFKSALLGLWGRDVPTLKEGGLSDAQLDLVASWCDQVESEHEVSF